MRIHDSIAIVGSAQLGLSGPCDCHVYAIRGGEGIVLIDAGAGNAQEQIVQNIRHDFPGQKILGILLTHAHADHSAGALALGKHFDCPLYAPEPSRAILEAGDEERCGLADARAAGAYPPEVQLKPSPVAAAFVHGERVEIAGLTFEAIQVRGHSEDSFCFQLDVKGVRALFAGDVVFYGGVLGVINSRDSGMQGYRADLGRLRDRQIEMLLPSHGLFTLRDGQRHIDAAIQSCAGGFIPRQIGQGDTIF